jgi:uncharacterized membrane protein
VSAGTLRRVWGVPLALAVATLVGLPVALFGDGAWDWLSAILLAVPVLVALERLWRGLAGAAGRDAPR